MTLMVCIFFARSDVKVDGTLRGTYLKSGGIN